MLKYRITPYISRATEVEIKNIFIHKLKKRDMM